MGKTVKACNTKYFGVYFDSVFHFLFLTTSVKLQREKQSGDVLELKMKTTVLFDAKK